MVTSRRYRYFLVVSCQFRGVFIINVMCVPLATLRRLGRKTGPKLPRERSALLELLVTYSANAFMFCLCLAKTSYILNAVQSILN